ncbi:zinc ribbon domain-containing protein [Olsenella sp. DSM 107455]|uniref:Zinc ribbon domain-containing protein n=1 Tax=Thermophilibacter gallinarum TaxID=2779357 RepID=A0ABR9QQC7_9ACTN|nr:DUF6273 domain-containing protein [Thermophilibacter gallinarum]MBE5023272.1 zinc ribbon domain-containing protein [Thermophilibacter gallinarum]
MKCKNCGEELPERARFCYACGTPVEDVPAPKRLEEPLAAGAVPLVPLAPPPRAYRMESRAARAAARGDRRLARAVTRALGTDADEQKKDAEPKKDELGEKDAATEAAVEETAAEKDVAVEAEPTVEKDVTSEVEEDVTTEAEETAEQAPEAEEDVEAAEDAPEEAVEEEPGPEGADEAEEAAVAEDAPEPEGADEPEEEPEAEATEPEADAAEEDVADDEPAGPEPAAEPEPDAAEPEPSAAEKTAAGATALLHRISEAASEDVIPAAKRGLSATKDTLSTAGEDLSAVGGRLSEYVKEMQGPRPVIIGIAVVALAVAIGALVWFGTSPLGPFAPRDENVPVVQPPSDGSIPPLEDDSEEAEEPAEEEPSELAPRASVAEYSWDELSQVSALIAAAPSDEEAVAIATEYHLCTDDGKLDGTQTKELELTDGTKVTVAVAGFRHDEKADGSGVAGVTFVTLGSIGKQAYNPSGDVTAWEDSPLRSWMNQSLMGELPEGLADLIVPVTKATGTPSGDLSETSDSMWLLSATELAGLATNGEEGSQYQLFSDQGVEGQSSVLKLCDDYWWLRGLTSDGQWQRTVDKDGSPSSGRNSLYEFDVVAGFCL